MFPPSCTQAWPRSCQNTPAWLHRFCKVLVLEETSNFQPVCWTEVQQSLTSVHHVSCASKAPDFFPTIHHAIKLCIEMSSYWLIFITVSILTRDTDMEFLSVRLSRCDVVSKRIHTASNSGSFFYCMKEHHSIFWIQQHSKILRLALSTKGVKIRGTKNCSLWPLISETVRHKPTVLTDHCHYLDH